MLAAVVKEALVVVAGLEGCDFLRDEGIKLAEVGKEVGWEGEGHRAMGGIGCHFERAIGVRLLVGSQLKFNELISCRSLLTDLRCVVFMR